MNRATKLLTAAITSLVLTIVVIETSLAKLSNRSNLSIRGIGDVPSGLTVAETAKAAGINLVDESPQGSCYHVKPSKNYRDISFMVVGGRVARVNVGRNSKVTTLRGAKIGDSEARIKSLYQGQIEVTRHEYVTGGHYLTFIPKDKVDRNYRVVFETDGKRVTRMRSGKLPEVMYVEGCS